MSGRDLLALTFRLIGALFLAVAVGVVIQVIVFLGSSTRTDGVVVSLSTVQNAIRFAGGDEPTGVLYYPVVEYVTRDGVRYEITGRRGTSEPQLRVGDSVAVLYRNASPAAARLDTVMGVWGSAIILAACGVLFLLISFLAPFGFGDTTEPEE